jgi:hypothetical protein
MLAGVLCLGGFLLAQDVKYNYDTSANFAKYHTYQWVALPTAHPDQLIDKQIRQAIEAQLAAKGLTPVIANGDIDVGYQIAVNHETQWNTWGSGGYRWGGGMAQTTSSTISVGTLGIDFFDPASKSVVWRGTGTKTLNPSSNPEKNMERLQKAIAKILKNFPPPQEKK